MKRVYTFIIVGAVACVAVTAKASFEQFSEQLRKHSEEADPERLVPGSVQKALDAGCSINKALKSGLAGDSKSFADALTDAEARLTAVADRLAPIAEKGYFNRLVLKTPRSVPLPGAPPMAIRTGNDVLKAIATLARRSADAIARIKNGKGNDEDFAEIVRNNAEISQLISDFYGIST